MARTTHKPPQPDTSAPALHVSMEAPYGKKQFYPENELANTFLELTGREKAFSEKQLALIKRLGYRVLIVAKPTEPREF